MWSFILIVVSLLVTGLLGPAVADEIYVLNKAVARVSVIEAASGEVVAAIAVGEGPHEAATTPDQRHVIVANYGGRAPGSTLSVIDTARREVVRVIELGDYHRPHGLALLADGRHCLVTAETEQKLLIVDLESGTVTAAIDTDQRISHMVTVGPAMKHAFVANIQSGSVSVIDLEEKRRVKSIRTGQGAEGIAAHPTRPEVWVTNRAEDSIAIVDTKSLEVVAKLPCKSFPIRVAFTVDGARALVTCPTTSDVAIFDVAERKEIRRVAMKAAELSDEQQSKRLLGDRFGSSAVPIGILMAPGGERALVANAHTDTLAEIDLGSWEVRRYLPVGEEPDGLAWVKKTATL